MNFGDACLAFRPPIQLARYSEIMALLIHNLESLSELSECKFMIIKWTRRDFHLQGP